LKGKIISVIAFLLLSGNLTAKLNTAVLRLCFEKDGKPLLMKTDDPEKGVKLNFSKYKETELYLRKMKIFLDDQPFFNYRPLNDNCFTVLKVPPGRHVISVDFKTASYTALIPENDVSHKYKADLLYEGKITVQEGPVSSLKLMQQRNKITAIQSVTNEPIVGCSDFCKIPAEVPIYFTTKSDDEKVVCPISYQLVLPIKDDNKHVCYNDDRIKSFLSGYVKESSIKCKSGIEYAQFTVFGDGCILTMKPDKTGLRDADPEIKLLPLEKQKIKYYISANGKPKEIYKFSVEKKGKSIIPEAGKKVIFSEVID